MIQLLVDLQWAIWTKGAWTEKDLSYSCYFGRHCLGINNGVSYSCIHSKKNTRKTRKYGSCSKVSKQNSKEPWIFVGKLCSCFLGRFVCRRNCTLQVSWSNQNIQQSNMYQILTTFQDSTQRNGPISIFTVCAGTHLSLSTFYIHFHRICDIVPTWKSTEKITNAKMKYTTFH